MDKSRIKKTRVSPISESETWKLNIIQEVSLVLKEQLQSECDEPYLDILNSVCTD